MIRTQFKDKEMEIYTEMFDVYKQKFIDFSDIVSANFHDYIEVLYAFGGKFSIWLDGEFYEFSKGDIVVINSNELHHIVISELDENSGYYALRFNPDILYISDKTICEFKYIITFMPNHTPLQKVFKAEEFKDFDVGGLMINIYEEFMKKEYAYELLIKSHICRLFAWIYRYWKSKDYCISETENLDLAAKLEGTIEYVLQHYSEDITARDMANYSNLSYSYFSRLFKRLTGKSFSEYLNATRVSEAEKLLLTSDMNITEIALEVGFSTASYFISQFKRQKGMSPKQFKKKYLSGAEI